MKNYLHQMAKYSALVLISSIPLPFDAFADDIDKKHIAPFVTPVDKTSTKRRLLQERSRQVSDEASDALTGTQAALAALEKNDGAKALGILQAVSAKLAVLQVKTPALPFIAADINAEVLDFDGDAEAIENALDQADDLLDAGKTQDARRLLDALVSEIRINTIGIPLSTFPVAVKDAVLLINAGKNNAAADVLDEVLNTLMTTTEVIPLPVLNAETLLTEASELEHKADLSKEQSREEVLKLVAAAKDKLQKAVLLGYGNKDDYKILYQAIDEIKETIHSESADATWKKIKYELIQLKNKLAITK